MGKRAQLCFFASLANPENVTICRSEKSSSDAEVSLLPYILSQSWIVVPTKSKVDTNSMIVRTGITDCMIGGCLCNRTIAILDGEWHVVNCSDSVTVPGLP